MADFLEERLLETVRFGSDWADEYAVDSSRTSGGSEYPRLIQPFPTRDFVLSWLVKRSDLSAYLLDLYHRAHGTYAAFRVRCFDEWSSNGAAGVPTAFDQVLTPLSAGVYEMRKYYGTSGTAGASGYPHRKIKKPVAGTVRFAIGSVELALGALTWAVDTTTGIITLPADGTAAITGISKAATARISLGALSGAINAGQSVYVSGVSGMTQINNLRALVIYVGTGYIDVAVNSTGFSTWTSGGVVHTRPQAGEQVTCGFEFDFPAAFIDPLRIGQDYPNHRTIESARLRERLNP